MRRVAWVALALVAVSAGGASAAGPPQVAFTSGDTFDNGDVVLATADGLTVTNLTPGKVNAFDDDRAPSWSPDGSKLAFVSHRDGRSTQEIYVMHADGSAPRRLTNDSGASQVFNVDPVWSPDGATIAWRRSAAQQDDIWLMNPDGTNRRRLTSDRGQKNGPEWSPDSTRLLWERRSGAGANGIFVGRPASGLIQAVSPAGSFDSTAHWGPEGNRIAFVSAGFVYVMNADGSARRQVGLTRGTSPAWSPDGKTIAFVGVRSFPEFGSRYGPAYRFDTYLVGADGANERRITGPAGDGFSVAPGGSLPTFSPDGSRIFFASFRSGDTTTTVWSMNADGSCEGRFAPSAPRLLSPPAWRPGAAGPAASACADLKLEVSTSTDTVGLRSEVVYTMFLENDGNLTATGVHVDATVSASAQLQAGSQGCSATETSARCDLPPLPAHATREVVLTARSATAGSIRFTVRVAASERDSDLSSNEALRITTVLPCSIAGTTGNDAIYGTPRADTICARSGADRIFGRQGNDVIDTGNGNDTVEGGKGRDRILGQGGRDVILVRDGERDTVDCGTEADLVVADAIDVVAKNCEEILRG